jgi:hypothetical protein
MRSSYLWLLRVGTIDNCNVCPASIIVYVYKLHNHENKGKGSQKMENKYLIATVHTFIQQMLIFGILYVAEGR